MGLFDFRKLLSRKTKKRKTTTKKTGKKTKGTKSKTGKRARPSPVRTRKVKRKTGRRVATKKAKKVKKGKKGQRGGSSGNYHLDVSQQNIGGLPVVNSINDCPKGVKANDATFGTAIYTQPVVGGGRGKKRSHKAKRTRKHTRK